MIAVAGRIDHPTCGSTICSRMCGILGIWQANGDAVDLSLLRTMATSLRHRGPDDEGYLLVDVASRRAAAAGGRDTASGMNLPDLDSLRGQTYSLALACRRLAIMDLSPAGHQPMQSADGRYAIVFNGEIYNHLELRRELEKGGREFRSDCDTEVLLSACAEWGARAIRRLVGMFAFALVDLAGPKLMLARDFAGMKPLYYAQSPNGFAFASEIKALLALPWVSRRANAQRLYDYLRFGITDHGDATMFASIQQVPAGSLVEIPLAPRVAPVPGMQRYWSPGKPRLDTKELTKQEAAGHLRELFLDSVRLHLRSNVPVGSCLSGGIDSSSIVSAVHVLEPAVERHTFTYCAGGSRDEETWADRVIGPTGAKAHKVRMQTASLAAELSALVEIQDEPFGGTSILAQCLVFRAARAENLSVLLDGQGADELLAGYPSFVSARLASLFTQGKLLEALKLWGHRADVSNGNQSDVLGEAAGLIVPDSLATIGRQLLGRPVTPKWIRADWFERHHVSVRPRWRRRGGDPFRQMREDAFVETSLPMLLRYEDRSSMAHSVESRLPFLTPQLSDFIFALPAEYVLDDDGVSKSVFRLAMRGLVPDAILDRRDKIGFATPECEWLVALNSWVGDALSGRGPAARLLHFDNLDSLRDKVHAGDGRAAAALWRCVNLIRWAEAFDVEFE